MQFQRIFSTILVATLFSSTVVGAELKPLETVKRELLSSGDVTRLEYGFIRCSALQTALGALMLRGGEKEASEKFLLSSFGYIQAAKVVHDAVNEKRGVIEDESLDSLSKASQQIVTIYVDRMSKNWAMNGDYVTSDEQLMEEVDLCKDQKRFLKWMTN